MSSQCSPYGCVVLHTVNVEEENIYSHRGKLCKLRTTQRVKTHSFQKCIATIVKSYSVGAFPSEVSSVV